MFKLARSRRKNERGSRVVVTRNSNPGKVKRNEHLSSVSMDTNVAPVKRNIDLLSSDSESSSFTSLGSGTSSLTCHDDSSVDDSDDNYHRRNNVGNISHQNPLNNDSQIIVECTDKQSLNQFSNISNLSPPGPLWRQNLLETDYREELDAEGNPRYIYREIEPAYDSDDTDCHVPVNTIGNIDPSYYDKFPHIGYDINGKKILRAAKGEVLDNLLDTIDIPEGWTGLTDPDTGKPLNLSSEQLDMLKRITQNEYGIVNNRDYDNDEDQVLPEMFDYFSRQTEIMPLSAAPEPKRRFLPSKHEFKRILKLVKAIKDGKIMPYNGAHATTTEWNDGLNNMEHIWNFDVWANEKCDSIGTAIPQLPAPKLPPPNHEESYHPPEEYLFTQDEKVQWLNSEPDKRETTVIPQDFASVRKIVGYDKFVKERFERCLDLYLAPRVQKNRVHIDAEALLPELPRRDQLGPFPVKCSTVYRGHLSRVRSVSIDSRGQNIASGGDDGCVRIFDLITARQIDSLQLSNRDPVNVVRWIPTMDIPIVMAACSNTIYFVLPHNLSYLTPEMIRVAESTLHAGFSSCNQSQSREQNGTVAPQSKKIQAATWTKSDPKQRHNGRVLLQLTLRSTVKVIVFHRRADYFATVSPNAQSHSVAIHQLSQHKTQLPFKKVKGLPQTAVFHPNKPVFFLATQRKVRIYDLAKQSLIRVLQPGARWISSIDIHPDGENLCVGTYDRRVLWHDLAVSTYPSQTLRFHDHAVRSVAIHKNSFPLFADASDDGTCRVFYVRTGSDELLHNVQIVPLTTLRGHSVKTHLGVLDIVWHPRHPWLISAGADGTCRLWT